MATSVYQVEFLRGTGTAVRLSAAPLKVYTKVVLFSRLITHYDRPGRSLLSVSPTNTRTYTLHRDPAARRVNS